MRTPHASRRLARAAIALALLPGCSGESSLDGGSSPGDGGGGAAPCAAGEVMGPDGACMAVGIQGCVEQFLGEDRLCHPSSARCDAGTIPKFDEGCISVGIPGCAALFLGEGGLCRPTIAACPPNTVPSPQEGCVALDGPDGCGTGTWGAIPDAPGTVYVDPSDAGGDGDGSRARPLTTVVAAMERVADGGTVALAGGVYDEPIDIAKGVHVVGRCASRVRVQGTREASGRTAVVTVGPVTGASLRGLEIGGAGVGVLARGARDLSLEYVHVVGARDVGVLASGSAARVTVAYSVIEGTTAGAAALGGVAAERGAGLSVEKSAIVANEVCGVIGVGAGTEVVVDGSVLEGNLSSSGYFGFGAVAEQGAKITVTRSAAVENTSIGLSASGGSTLIATESLIAATRTNPLDRVVAYGAQVSGGASLTLESVAVDDNGSTGVLVGEGGTLATISRSLIQRTRTLNNAAANDGMGVLVLDGARAVLRSSALLFNGTSALHVVKSSADAEGTLFEGTRQLPPGDLGAGVDLDASEVTLTSNALVRNAVVGMDIFGTTTLTASNNLVEGTLPHEPTKHFGRGVEIPQASVVTFTANLITDNHDTGVRMGVLDEPSPTATFVDNLIQNTRSDEADDTFGVGVSAAGMRLTMTRNILRDNRMIGMFVVRGQDVQLTQTLVDGVPGGRVEPFGDIGDGIIVNEGVVNLTDTRVVGCSRAGILYLEGAGSFTRVRATRNRLGLVVQGTTQPIFADDSDFAGNIEHDRDLSGNLSVPNAPTPLPGE